MLRVIFATAAILGFGIPSANAQFREPPRLAAPTSQNSSASSIAQTEGARSADIAPTPRKKYEVKPGRVNMTANVPACALPLDLDKYVNLVRAGRQDAADQYSCIVLEEGSRAIAVDRIGSKYMQILIDRDGKTETLWTYHRYALDDRAFVFFKECGEQANPTCTARVITELD